MKKMYLTCALLLSYVVMHAVNVTFRVDMTNQTVHPSGVHIAGAFQGWNPSGTPMSDSDMDNIWEVTLDVTANTFFEYKFLNGNFWGADEGSGLGCATRLAIAFSLPVARMKCVLSFASMNAHSVQAIRSFVR
jgi:hypothetical protein